MLKPEVLTGSVTLKSSFIVLVTADWSGDETHVTGALEAGK